MTSPLQPWTVRAVNLPEHSDNIVHTDAGALAAGYPSALVAGTTVYAYLSHPPAAAWGLGWLANGQTEVRFLTPVFADDAVTCFPNDNVIEARVGGDVRATLAVSQQAEAPGEQVGEALGDLSFALNDELAGYGTRAGDDLDLYATNGVVHAATWPVIGNRVTMAHLVDGPWIHVRSRVRHLGLASMNSEALVESTVIDRFTTRAGDRVILDVRISVDGQPVAQIDHESIIRLAD